jgi:hypothetical protein
MFVNPVKNCTKYSLAKKVTEQVDWLNEQLNKQIDLNSKLALKCGQQENWIIQLQHENEELHETISDLELESENCLGRLSGAKIQ